MGSKKLADAKKGRLFGDEKGRLVFYVQENGVWYERGCRISECPGVYKKSCSVLLQKEDLEGLDYCSLKYSKLQKKYLSLNLDKMTGQDELSLNAWLMDARLRCFRR